MKFQHNLITILHKTSGRKYYTFDHWPQNEGCYACTRNVPDHTTQTIEYIPIDECELIVINQ